MAVTDSSRECKYKGNAKTESEREGKNIMKEASGLSKSLKRQTKSGQSAKTVPSIGKKMSFFCVLSALATFK